ncbi:hypothetical protein ACU4GD_32100 [Cupriavidus basilensis]
MIQIAHSGALSFGHCNLAHRKTVETTQVLPARSKVSHAATPMSSALVALFSLCAGVLVANLYYHAQPIIELIAPAVGLSASRKCRVSSFRMTQIRCTVRVRFSWVPLADLHENRRLLMKSAAFAARPSGRSPEPRHCIGPGVTHLALVSAAFPPGSAEACVGSVV